MHWHSKIGTHTHNNYVNPPFRLIGKILQVIETQGAYATLIAPYWPAQSWFRKLLNAFDITTSQTTKVGTHTGRCTDARGTKKQEMAHICLVSVWHDQTQTLQWSERA